MSAARFIRWIGELASRTSRSQAARTHPWGRCTASRRSHGIRVPIGFQITAEAKEAQSDAPRCAFSPITVVSPSGGNSGPRICNRDDTT